MRGAVAAVVWVAALGLVGCSGNNSNPGFGGGNASSSGGGGSGSSGGTGSSGSSSGSFGGSSGGSGGSGSSGGGNNCSGQAADYVYVLSAENTLYSFAPNLKKFTMIGPLQCQTTMQPNSMAVDRNANAYVNYVQSDPTTGTDTAGVVYKVSTKDASCSPQPLMNLPNGWYRTGMGYSSDTSGGQTETLYLDGVSNGVTGSGMGIGRVDLGAGVVTPIGPFTGTLAGQNAELTGTGDARLFGFFTTTPVYVAQIDKTTGATANPVAMNGVQTPTDWAFSFWGGHFYLYVSQGAGTTVADYDPATGSVNPNYMPNIGFDIVGAGVSTCAPIVQPQ
ncbi:MAG TPA: hypothetical protein VF765_13605 [Polyangiaceae bacterium]